MIHSVISLLCERSTHSGLSRADSGQRIKRLDLVVLCCCQRETTSRVAVIKLVAILTHVVPNLLNFLEVLRPLCNAVSRLFLLQSSQDGLIFYSNLHQFILALNAVKTWLRLAVWIVQFGLTVLHNVRHLLE